jgi:hypothetical protein
MMVSTHVRLSDAGSKALAEYARRHGMTKANAAAQILNEYIYGHDRTPGKPAAPLLPDVASGQVYIIKAGRYFKIGKAKNAKARIRVLRLPFKHKAVAVFDVLDRHVAEKYLHRKFASQRVNGEWFRLSADDITGISRDLPGMDDKKGGKA